MIPAPTSQQELLERARAIAGQTIYALARRLDQATPTQPQHAKGWTGQLIELALGADAASRAQPDFRALGIELKTLPVLRSGKPKESTYVCTVPLLDNCESEWTASWVRRKLQQVLWIPFEADPAIPLAQRRIGSAILWTPSAQQDAQLRQDWEEHMDLLMLGRVEEISAHHGTYLQIRPKAADRTALRLTTDEAGNQVQTLPRGFYLRTRFTAQILAAHYA